MLKKKIYKDICLNGMYGESALFYPHGGWGGGPCEFIRQGPTCLYSVMHFENLGLCSNHAQIRQKTNTMFIPP